MCALSLSTVWHVNAVHCVLEMICKSKLCVCVCVCVRVHLLPNQSLDSSSFSLGSSLGVKTFCMAASRLLAAVARSIQQCLPLQRESYPPNLETEWKEFFAEGVYSFLFPLFIRSIGMKLHHYILFFFFF